MSMRTAFVTMAFALSSAGVAAEAGASSEAKGPCAGTSRDLRRRQAGAGRDREMHESARGRAFPRVPDARKRAPREPRGCARNAGPTRRILQGIAPGGGRMPVLPEEPGAELQPRVRGGIQARGEPQAAADSGDGACVTRNPQVAEMTGALKIRPATGGRCGAPSCHLSAVRGVDRGLVRNRRADDG